MKRVTKTSALADLRFEDDGTGSVAFGAGRALTTREDYAGEIRRLWQRAHDTFVLIGRRLNQAKETLPHGEFEAMIARELPFSPSVGRRLRAVAAAIDAGELPIDRLPPSYSIAYDVLVLPPEDRAAALDEGVIRPDMRRQDLTAWRRARTPSDGPPNDQDARTAELARLLAERERLDQRIAALQAELAAKQ